MLCKFKYAVILKFIASTDAMKVVGIIGNNLGYAWTLKDHSGNSVRT